MRKRWLLFIIAMLGVALLAGGCQGLARAEEMTPNQSLEPIDYGDGKYRVAVTESQFVMMLNLFLARHPEARLASVRIDNKGSPDKKDAWGKTTYEFQLRPVRR